jgi:hypothetical protein
MNTEYVEEHMSCLFSLDHLDCHEYVPLEQIYLG